MFSVAGTYIKKSERVPDSIEWQAKIKDFAREHNVEGVRPDFGLLTLVRALKKKNSLPVIILIDESAMLQYIWSKSLHGTVKSKKLASAIAEILNNLFVKIKVNTEYFWLVWEFAMAIGFRKEEITSYLLKNF